MTERKFTPPTQFPAEYVDSNGDKAVILGRVPHPVRPFIGYDFDGEASSWTEEGSFFTEAPSRYDLHDIPKRITTWHNVYGAWVGPQCTSRSDADIVADQLRIMKRLCVYRIERDEDGGNFEMFKEEV